MPKKRILVTGANGQLGYELLQLEPASDAEMVFTTREALELHDESAIVEYVRNGSFDVIINAAAYTAVDKAETEVEHAEAINRDAVGMLAKLAKELGIALVHISTDYVFDGKGYRPYVEDDVTAPQGVYGRTKCEGEEAMLKHNPDRSVIIRTSWVYSSHGNNFVKTMMRLGQERDALGVIFDQVGSPTYARDLAQVIMQIIPKLDHTGVEILHYSNEGACSWYDFAKAIFEISGIACHVNAIETSQYPTPATRPHYSLMNKGKIKTHYDVDVPYWRDSLKACIALLKENP